MVGRVLSASEPQASRVHGQDAEARDLQLLELQLLGENLCGREPPWPASRLRNTKPAANRAPT